MRSPSRHPARLRPCRAEPPPVIMAPGRNQCRRPSKGGSFNNGDTRRHQRIRAHRPAGASSAQRAASRHPGRGRRQRSDGHDDQRPPLQVRHQLRRLPRQGRGHRGQHRHRRQRRQGPLGEGPLEAPLGRHGGRRGSGVDRILHRRRQGRRPPRGRRQEGHHLCARKGRGRHNRPRRERGQVRSEPAQRPLERLVHHQLRCDHGQGAGRQLWDRKRPDEHDPLLHQRPEDTPTRSTATSGGPGPPR